MFIGCACLAALVAASVPPASSQAEPFPTSAELLAIDDAALHGTITPPGIPLLEKEAEPPAPERPRPADPGGRLPATGQPDGWFVLGMLLAGLGVLVVISRHRPRDSA